MRRGSPSAIVFDQDLDDDDDFSDFNFFNGGCFLLK